MTAAGRHIAFGHRASACLIDAVRRLHIKTVARHTDAALVNDELVGEVEGLRSLGQRDLLVLRRQPDDWLLVLPEQLQLLDRRRELAFAAVHDDEVGEGDIGLRLKAEG